ncbi:glycoside hydrolase family 55 protein [Streptomyces sp. 8L]|uniref:glycoside hydrolase family 55 protein n=1 Tax=Streptomyces sp. 8L TaxID=2877242 RepID=UPI001CD3E1F4|nr:glycoside hydrolase family 55 protein [Streptomyces sp. 8L]MCA1222295.1 glycoside hydrolase family 55 protein [Streptomyces sp. 8L]
MASPEEPGALWDEFTASPFTHPQIPYVGRSGARAGKRELPSPEVVADVRDFGARGDGATDDAPALNRALAAAGARGGGAVLVPPGRYRIEDVVRVGHDGVVLRGAGSGRTTLYAPRDLTGIIGPYGPRDGGAKPKSGWSWAGGLVWLCAADRYTELVGAIADGASPCEGWSGNTRTAWRPLTAVAPAARGDRTVVVADPGAVAEGALVVLRLADDAHHTLLAHMAGGGPGAAAYDWASKTKLTSYPPYEWPVRVAGVLGDVVELERPLPLDVRPEWEPVLAAVSTPPLVGAGVEGLTVEAARAEQSPHLLDTGRNGVVVQCAYDCWVDDVVVTDVDNGFGLVAASACTLRRTRVQGRGAHHPYFCREGSHDNLTEDFEIGPRAVEPPDFGGAAENPVLHGINAEGLSSHNVWSRGRMAAGTFDTHRGLPFANVRTEITVENDGRHGGDGSAGPLYGARFTHWNITVTNGRAGLVRLDGIAPYSATVAVSEVSEFGQVDEPDFIGDLHTRLAGYGHPEAARPVNLYEAQRELPC